MDFRAAALRQVSESFEIIYVKTPLPLIRKRLSRRRDHEFTVDMLDDWLTRHWQEPKDEDYLTIDNSALLTI